MYDIALKMATNAEWIYIGIRVIVHLIIFRQALI